MWWILCVCVRGQLSVITNLRNPTLKPRHWEEVEAILEVEFTPEEPLTLGRLVEIDAFDLAEQLEEISGKASSEAGLESILKKVCDLKYGPHLHIWFLSTAACLEVAWVHQNIMAPSGP